MNPEETEKNSPPPPSFSFSSLPEEITVNYLARISRSHYPRLSVVSKSFLSLTSSTELYSARSKLETTEHCLYVCLRDPSCESPKWFTLYTNPNPKLVPIPSCNLPCSSKSVVSVGSEIYVVGGGPVSSSAVQILDCCSHKWRDGPSMKVSRKDAVACAAHDGKIYVLGGCEKKDETWAEVFDTKTQSWENLPDPGIPKHAINTIAEMDGKIVFRDVEHNTYGYNLKQCKWERCENITSMTECVVDNVSYVYKHTLFRLALWWSQSNVKDNLFWRDVKGLESLGDKYMSSGPSGMNKLVSCGGGNFFMVWEADRNTKIWCAKISLETRSGGVVWGQVKWVNAVLTVPRSCQVLQCVAVTL